MPVFLRYRKTANAIAAALWIFVGVNLVRELVLTLSPTLFLSPIANEIFAELLGGLLYMAMFALPAFLFRYLSPVPPLPIQLSRELPRKTPFYLLFGLAAISVAAYFNTFFVSLFGYDVFSEQVLFATAQTENYQLVLLFLNMVLIPAFFEELFFRGVVLSNLLPYGQKTAVLGSALLFALMHGNIGQLFYAMVAGVVLGWIYLRTRSIWGCVLLHFVNNFLSVFLLAVSERVPENKAAAIIFLVEGGILLFGILAGIFLLWDRKKKPYPTKSACGMSRGMRIRGFFTLPMALFCVWCVLQMILLILLSQIYLFMGATV